jgi:predicted ATPase/DNA-binding CsgD family transcriptional regulator
MSNSPTNPVLPGAIALPPLSRPLTPLIGRDLELQSATALLQRVDARLVTFTGPGGVGKSRLALQVAIALRNDPHAVIDAGFVQLAHIRDPNLVLPTIAQALALRGGGEYRMPEHLADALGGHPMLLVLDNFEHVLDAAPLVVQLVIASPNLKILVTSRAPLRVRGERAIPVSPLGRSDRASQTGASSVATSPAVVLFLDRARRAKPDFAVNAETLTVVAEICDQLDGLPLAIELAAARCRVLFPAAVRSRLHHRLPFLVGGPRDLPAHQQTMRGAIAWSFDLLTPDSQVVFRRFAVFAGGATLDAVEAVCGGQGTDDGKGVRERGLGGDGRASVPGSPFPVPSVLDGLSLLIELHLVTDEPPRAGPRDSESRRFGMLETIREFALDRLAASGETDWVRERHAAYYTAMAAALTPDMIGPRQTAALNRVATDLANLRAAWNWHASAKWHPLSIDAIETMVQYWLVRGPLAEVRAWCDRLVAEFPTSGASDRARLFHLAANVARQQRDFAAATALYEQSLALRRANGDALGIARALQALAVTTSQAGDFPRSAALSVEALDLFRHLGDRSGIARSIYNLGALAVRRGEFAQAREPLTEALAIFRDLGDDDRAASALYFLGEVALSEDDFEHAEAHNAEAVAIWRGLGAWQTVGHALYGQARIARARGDVRRAAGLLKESVALGREENDAWHVARCLLEFVQMASSAGCPAKAATFLGASERLFDWRTPPMRPEERDTIETAISRVREDLGAMAFETVIDKGRQLTVDQIDTEVAALIDAPTPSGLPETGEPPSAFGLTPREIDVLRLIATGMSDREIGETLYISHRTVMVHVRNLLAKMDVPSRTAAANLALRSGLVKVDSIGLSPPG